MPDGDALNSIFKTDMSIISDGNDFMEKLIKIKINSVEKNRINWIKTCHDRYKNNKSTKKPRSANDGLDFGHLIDIINP